MYSHNLRSKSGVCTTNVQHVVNQGMAVVLHVNEGLMKMFDAIDTSHVQEPAGRVATLKSQTVEKFYIVHNLCTNVE